MRYIVAAALACALLGAAASAADQPAAPPAPAMSPPLAYFVAQLHLDAGENMTPEQGQVLLTHVGHLTELYDQGVLFMAGPFDSGTDGIEVLQAHSLEEARGYVESDPAVKSGLMKIVSVNMWWAAFSRPDNQRYSPEQMMQEMEQQPNPVQSSRAPQPDGALVTLAADMAPAAPDNTADTAGPPDGKLVHFELPSTDLKQSEAFYGKVFGWQFQSMGDAYLLFQTPGGEGGGFTKDYAPGDGGGTFYIYAADVKAKLAEVVAAGGTVVLETFAVPGYGWIALFKDPQGNRVGLFSAKNPPAGESPVPPMPGKA